jgi:excisionase family DNA binding protein
MIDADHGFDLVTVREAARLLRQSDVSIRRKIRTGELRGYRVGEFGPLRLRRADVLEHLHPAHGEVGRRVGDLAE